VLSFLIQAVVLVSIIGWLDGFSDADLSDYIKAGVIALVTGLIGFAAAVGLAAAIPAAGDWIPAIVGLAVSSLSLGVAIAVFYGIEMQRAMMGAGIFLVVNAIVSLALGVIF